MSLNIVVPSLGESITEATVGRWLKAAGDAVAADEPVVTLETDKVSVEVPAPGAGIMGETAVKEGDTVEVGDVLATINLVSTAGAKALKPGARKNGAHAGDGSQATARPAQTIVAPLPPPDASREAIAMESDREVRARPSGEDGSFATGGNGWEPAPEALAYAKARTGFRSGSERGETRVRMSQLRQTAAYRLKHAQNTAAILTTFNDVDMTAVLRVRERYKAAFEEKYGVRSGLMGFFAKAACAALKQVPIINASLDGDEVVYHERVNLSVAVATPNGLIVPVIAKADELSVGEIEQRIAELGGRAKNGTLSLAELRGGTFTISNGGVFGSLMSTPIVNHPESAVLGLHRVEDRAVVVDGQITVRPMMYLALSYDHRMIDGREAVTFLKAIKTAIEDPVRLLLDV